MPPAIRALRKVLAVTSIALLACAGCGGESGRDAAADTAVKTTSGEQAATQTKFLEFCSAVEALDQTDGTTADDVVLQALDDLRQAAPEEVRDDVMFLADNLIINDYPTGIEPSMKKAPMADVDAAGKRLGAFVDENCNLSG